CPAKMINLLSPEDLDLKLLLTQQLVEEYHHYQVFAKLVADRGAESDLTRLKAGPAHNGMFEKTLSWDHPVYIAATSNLTGEFILTVCMEKLVTLVNKESARVIEEEVMAHEGNHIHNGRLILERYATDPGNPGEGGGAHRGSHRSFHRFALEAVHGVHRTRLQRGGLTPAFTVLKTAPRKTGGCGRRKGWRRQMAQGIRFRAVRVHTLALPPDVTKKLDSIVTRERRTVTEIVTSAVRRYLEEYTPSDKEDPENRDGERPSAS
ncbi:MAG: hypothetical protein QGH70_10565, partial [Nitrospinota bacterium]|nr:hypothetical protein [Nitrospinota bacterium]